MTIIREFMIFTDFMILLYNPLLNRACVVGVDTSPRSSYTRHYHFTSSYTIPNFVVFTSLNILLFLVYF